MAASTRKAATNGGHPTSNAKLAVRVRDLEARIEALEEIINQAKARQEEMLAAKLAENPAQLAQLQSIMDMAARQRG